MVTAVNKKPIYILTSGVSPKNITTMKTGINTDSLELTVASAVPANSTDFAIIKNEIMNITPSTNPNINASTENTALALINIITAPITLAMK